MSFNKSKAMRNAERYLTQGKIQAAIGEYKSIVEHDPKDVNTMNMLGDLYAKSNDSQAAMNCYQQVADHYHEQGFAKKAISIYNKIHRIEPNSLEVSEKLADLYRVRGSIAEAKKHYLDVSKIYEEKGYREKALEVWEIIGEIDPNNTDIYLKIADVYWRDNRKDEAAKAFIESGLRLSKASQHEAAVTAFSRALEILPDDVVALNGFVNSQIQLGYPEEAAKVLEELQEKDPYNKEIVYLLIDCYFEMEKPENAEKVIIGLVEREPANYSKLIDLVDVYLEKDDLESTVRVLSMVSEHLLIDGKPDKLSGYINEVLARNPEQIEALRLQARFYGWQKDELELQRTLERLVEASRINESIEDERYALSQLLLIIPHDTDYANRFKEINEQYDFDDEVVGEQLLGTSNGSVPDFESYATLNGDEHTEESKDFEFESNNYSDEELEESDESVPTEDYYSHDDSDITEEAQEYQNQSEELEEEPVSELTEENSEPKSEEKLSLSDEREIEEEIESINFYIEQGYVGLAEKSLKELEKKFGKQAQFNELWEQLGIEPEPIETNEEVKEEAEPQAQEPEIVELSEDAVVVEEDFEDDQEVVEEESFSVADSIEPIQEEVIQESLEQFESEEEEDSPQEVQENNDFDDFKNELGFEDASDDESEDDYDNHYHHAIAYKEMGLLEDAIREFQDAANCVKVNDGTRRFFQCCSLLGHCFMEKQMPHLALVWLQKGFETEDLSEEEKQGLNYEVANAHEANGEVDEARKIFEQIYAVDVDYRDVVDRIEKLKQALVT